MSESRDNLQTSQHLHELPQTSLAFVTGLQETQSPIARYKVKPGVDGCLISRPRQSDSRASFAVGESMVIAS